MEELGKTTWMDLDTPQEQQPKIAILIKIQSHTGICRYTLTPIVPAPWFAGDAVKLMAQMDITKIHPQILWITQCKALLNPTSNPRYSLSRNCLPKSWAPGFYYNYIIDIPFIFFKYLKILPIIVPVNNCETQHWPSRDLQVIAKNVTKPHQDQLIPQLA